MPENKQKRVTVYVPESKYQKLRIKLMVLGKTVSGWFREEMDKILKEK